MHSQSGSPGQPIWFWQDSYNSHRGLGHVFSWICSCVILTLKREHIPLRVHIDWCISLNNCNFYIKTNWNLILYHVYCSSSGNPVILLLQVQSWLWLKCMPTGRVSNLEPSQHLNRCAIHTQGCTIKCMSYIKINILARNYGTQWLWNHVRSTF